MFSRYWCSWCCCWWCTDRCSSLLLENPVSLPLLCPREIIALPLSRLGTGCLEIRPDASRSTGTRLMPFADLPRYLPRDNRTPTPSPPIIHEDIIFLQFFSFPMNRFEEKSELIKINRSTFGEAFDFHTSLGFIPISELFDNARELNQNCLVFANTVGKIIRHDRATTLLTQLRLNE